MAGLIDRVGIDEALKVVETEQEAEFGTVLLVEWLTKYVNSLTGVQDDGRRKYLAYIRNDIIPFFGERAPLDAVTQDTDAAWIVYLQQDKGNPPKTISDKHAILSAMLRAAVEQRPVPLLPYNPCAGMRLPRHDWAEIDVFDNDEWGTVRAAAAGAQRPPAPA
ncbi:hypothetical protein IU486_34450 [Streptomyces gardneri]|nr:hypothetical protein [Streptomyces gardneri]